MISRSLLKRFYPDARIGGTHLFYNWVRKHVNEDTQLLNLGAGPATKSELRSFKGHVARVVGADIDPIVYENEELDEAVTITDDSLPLPDKEFDIVVSDYTFEHVERPLPFLAEAFRVLRPGGHLFFRTPSRFHYVPLIAQLTPHWFHKLVANRARGLDPDAHEPWPTCYQLNSQRSITNAATAAGFSGIELRTCEAEPSYLVFASLPFLAGVAYERMVNRFETLKPLRANIFGRLTR